MKSSPRACTPPDLAELRAEVAALHGPELARCVAPSRRPACEARAAHVFRSAVSVLPKEWSDKRIANEIERCERMVIDYRKGARNVPLDVIFMLPEEAQACAFVEMCSPLTRGMRIAIVRRLLESIQDLPDARVA